MCVLGNEFLGGLPGLVVGYLAGWGFHEVTRGTGQRPGNPVVQGQFDTADGVNDYSGRVGGVPNFELHLTVERHIPKGGALHPDIAPFAVLEPRDVIAWAHMCLLRGQLVVHLAGHGLCF